MGMFDSFYFKDGVLPDNKVPEGHEFQTKSLDCDLDVYNVDSEGNVEKGQYWNGQRELDTKPINCAAEVYSNEFMYDNPKDTLNHRYLGSKYQEYKIIILNSKIAYVEKLHESGYEVDKPEE